MRKKEVRSIESPFNVFKCHVWRRKLKNISTFYVNAQFLSAKPLFNDLFNTISVLLCKINMHARIILIRFIHR